MSEQITTTAELDALLHAVGELAEAAVVREPFGQPWFITEDDRGGYWADTYPNDGDDHIRADSLALPLAVLYRPDQPPRPESVVKAEARAEELRDFAEFIASPKEAGLDSYTLSQVYAEARHRADRIEADR